MQVSERERRVELDESFRDVASVILEKCINPETNRPYTMGLIQRGLRDIHFAVDPKRSVKQQVRGDVKALRGLCMLAQSKKQHAGARRHLSVRCCWRCTRTLSALCQSAERVHALRSFTRGSPWRAVRAGAGGHPASGGEIPHQARDDASRHQHPRRQSPGARPRNSTCMQCKH